VALAGLGQLPPTIADRAVLIAMKKRKHTERVQPWRERVNASEAKALGEYLCAWMEKTTVSWPNDLPVEDRTADVWEALVMVADAAGGHWPATARAAAIALTCNGGDASVGVQLLRDLQTVFGEGDKLSSRDIIKKLSELPESPWPHFHGSDKAINAVDLSKLLKGYGIRSKDVWLGDRSAKGYTADDLRDAWERYLRPTESVRPARSARVQVRPSKNLADHSHIADGTPR
jgi:hypothetical protein